MSTYYSIILYSTIISRQERIQDSRRKGRQPSEGGPTYDFAKCSEKLHEIEKILGRGGGACHGEPPLDPHAIAIHVVE